ncbi:hypothetical protein SALBM217S_10770 [Streptomyces griseoloalbus]
MEQTHTSHNGTATTTPGAQRRVLVVEDDAEPRLFPANSSAETPAEM